MEANFMNATCTALSTPEESVSLVRPTSISNLLTPREAAKVLKTTYGSLAVWRCARRKPLRFVRLGRKIFYRAQDIEQFIESQLDPGDGPKPARFAKKKAARR
jgi:Helix-turn-helix domain